MCSREVSRRKSFAEVAVQAGKIGHDLDGFLHWLAVRSLGTKGSKMGRGGGDAGQVEERCHLGLGPKSAVLGVVKEKQPARVVLSAANAAVKLLIVWSAARRRRRSLVLSLPCLAEKFAFSLMML